VLIHNAARPLGAPTMVTGWGEDQQEKKPPSVLAGGSLGALILGSEMSSTRRSLGRSTMR